MMLFHHFQLNELYTVSLKYIIKIYKESIKAIKIILNRLVKIVKTMKLLSKQNNSLDAFNPSLILGFNRLI